jgi:hypothetical protein
MARGRDDRYQSAAELQRDLQALRNPHGPPPLVLGKALRVFPSRPAARAAADERNGRPVPPPASAILAPPNLPEPSSSSLEIPITFSNDTPPSGESLPAVDSEVEEYPMRADVSPPSDGRAEDALTTQKRGPEFASALARVRESIRDTGATGPWPVHHTDAAGRPSAGRAQADSSRNAPSDEDTLIEPWPGRVVPRGAATRRAPSPGPDDTVRLDAEPDAGDPTQLMASRRPKAPRS